MFVDELYNLNWIPWSEKVSAWDSFLEGMFLSPLQKCSGQTGSKTERDQKLTHIKGSLMFELSCTLSSNDYCRNTESNSWHAASNLDLNLRGQGLPDVSGVTLVNLIFSSACFRKCHVFSCLLNLDFLHLHIFLFSSAYPLLWRDSYLCVWPLQASRLSYRGCHVGRESGITVSAMYYIMLCQTDLPDARGGSLTEKFGVASFIVIEHLRLSDWVSPILACYCWGRCFLLKQATISCLCIKTPWIGMMVGLDYLGS